jgi:hypothetical protein
MTNKFDVKNKHKLDNAQRREMLPPEETLISLGLQGFYSGNMYQKPKI